MAQEKQRSAIKALQDVKKMRRLVRARNETDPSEVASILDNILRDSLVARQALGASRIGKNATNELKHVRNDIIAGRMNLGGRREEYLAKFTTAFNEVKKLDKEEAQISKSGAKQQAKEAVSSIIPRKEMVMSAVMASNPILGYGLKIGRAAFGGSKPSGSRVGVDKLKSLQQGLGGTSSSGGPSTPKGLMDFKESSNAVEENLGLIHDELKTLNNSIERLVGLNGQSVEHLEGVERQSKATSDLRRIQSNRSTFTGLESELEGYGVGGSSSQFSDSSSNTEDALVGLVAGSLSSSQSIGGGLDTIDIAAGTAVGGGAKSILGTVVKSAPFLLGMKAALVGAVVYAGWKYKDNIWKGLLDAFSSGSDPIDRKGIRPGPSTEERSTEQIYKDAAKADPATIAAREAVESTKDLRDNYSEELMQLEKSWDKLVDKSNEELEENGQISRETRETMLENNRRQVELKDEVKTLSDRIRELNQIAATIEAKRTSFYRNNPDHTPLSRVDGKTGGLLNLIGQTESGNNYNALVYGRNGANTPSEAPLTDMTIAEVQQYQAGMPDRGHASGAVGKYQMMPDTLREMVEQNPNISMQDKFTPDVQEQIAMQLLERRGLSRYLSGEKSESDFAKGLANEWAALPLGSGLSAHAGKAGNQAGTSYGKLISSIRTLKNSQIEMDPSATSSTNVSEHTNGTLDRGNRTTSTGGSNNQPVVVNNNTSVNNQSGSSGRTIANPESSDPTWRSLNRTFDLSSL